MQCGMHGAGICLMSKNASTVARVGKRHVLTEVSHEMLVCRTELLLAFRIVYKIFYSSKPATFYVAGAAFRRE